MLASPLSLDSDVCWVNSTLRSREKRLYKCFHPLQHARLPLSPLDLGCGSKKHADPTVNSPTVAPGLQVGRSWNSPQTLRWGRGGRAPPAAAFGNSFSSLLISGTKPGRRDSSPPLKTSQEAAEQLKGHLPDEWIHSLFSSHVWTRSRSAHGRESGEEVENSAACSMSALAVSQRWSGETYGAGNQGRVCERFWGGIYWLVLLI